MAGRVLFFAILYPNFHPRRRGASPLPCGGTPCRRCYNIRQLRLRLLWVAPPAWAEHWG